MPARSDATDLLLAWSQGDESAFDKLVPLVYQELHALARRYMRGERSDHTLQATALVNEAYVRLIDVNRIQWQNRAHFLAVAAQTMRRILVEFARHRRRQKRGGDVVRVAIDDAMEIAQDKEPDLRRSVERRAVGAGDVRSTNEPGGGIAILRWPHRPGNRRRVEGVARDGDARLENGEGVAPSRTESLEFSVRARRKSMACCKFR